MDEQQLMQRTLSERIVRIGRRFRHHNGRLSLSDKALSTSRAELGALHFSERQVASGELVSLAHALHGRIGEASSTAIVQLFGLVTELTGDEAAARATFVAAGLRIDRAQAVAVRSRPGVMSVLDLCSTN